MPEQTRSRTEPKSQWPDRVMYAEVGAFRGPHGEALVRQGVQRHAFEDLARRGEIVEEESEIWLPMTGTGGSTDPTYVRRKSDPAWLFRVTTRTSEPDRVVKLPAFTANARPQSQYDPAPPDSRRLVVEEPGW